MKLRTLSDEHKTHYYNKIQKLIRKYNPIHPAVLGGVLYDFVLEITTLLIFLILSNCTSCLFHVNTIFQELYAFTPTAWSFIMS